MHAQFSELVEISKLNGDFKKNYGKIIGGLSLSALNQRRSRPITLLDWLDLNFFFGGDGFAGETRLGLVKRRMSERTRIGKASKQSIPRLARTFSENLTVARVMIEVGNNR
jgi:hypothetical protein